MGDILQESRNTRQRELILNCLKQNSSRHLTICEIQHLLDRAGDSVGTATIYRHLSRLLELNVVRKFKLDGQSGACYQYVEDREVCCAHFHLICSVCSRTVHFQDKGLVDLFCKINRTRAFQIDLPKTVFYGICENCLSK